MLADFVSRISHRLLEQQPYQLGKLLKDDVKMTLLTFEVFSGANLLINTKI